MRPRPRLIPEALHTSLLEQAAGGMSLRKIAQWLQEEHSVKASHMAVSDLLQELKRERWVTAKAVTAGHLAAHVTTDLDMLSEVRDTLMETFRALKGTAGITSDTIGVKPRASVLREVASELRQVLVRKLELAGAGAGGEVAEDLSLLTDEELDELDRLTATAHERRREKGEGTPLPH